MTRRRMRPSSPADRERPTQRTNRPHQFKVTRAWMKEQTATLEAETRASIDAFVARMLDDFAIERVMLRARLREMDDIALNVLAAWMR
jgi:hypothetical protein